MKQQSTIFYVLYSLVFISFTVLVSMVFLQCNKTITKTEIQDLSFYQTNIVLEIGQTGSLAILANPKPLAGAHAYQISTLPAEQDIITYALTQNGEYINITGKKEGFVQLKLSSGKATDSINIQINSNNLVPKPTLFNVNMPNLAQDYDASGFENQIYSPEFIIKGIDVATYPYLSILMADRFERPLGTAAEFNWLHWEQLNIDITSLVQNQLLKIYSQDNDFNQSTNENYIYQKMTPPDNSGLHEYHFFFFFHESPKNFTHSHLGCIHFLSEDCPTYVDDFLQHFDTEDAVIKVIGKIQK